MCGISFDPPEENRAWASLMGFPFPLLSDPDHEAAVAMGAERDPDDRLFGLPRRISYLVDPDGVIRRSYRVARDEISEHAETVLADLVAELERA